MDTLRAALVGCAGIGKSSLARAIAQERFEYDYVSTIGADIKYRYFQEDRLKIHLWDLAGDPRFEKIIESYIGNSPVVVGCYDCSNYDSYDTLKRRIIKLRNSGYLKDKHMIIVSLKEDLDKTNESWGSELAVRFECPFIKVSSRTGHGVDNFLQELLNIGRCIYPRYFTLEEEPQREDTLCGDRCVIC